METYPNATISHQLLQVFFVLHRSNSILFPKINSILSIAYQKKKNELGSLAKQNTPYRARPISPKTTNQLNRTIYRAKSTA